MNDPPRDEAVEQDTRSTALMDTRMPGLEGRAANPIDQRSRDVLVGE